MEAAISISTSIPTSLSISPLKEPFKGTLLPSYRNSQSGTQETTLNYGGAQYIPTGRGLATQREPFVKNFRCFAPSHLFDAMEAPRRDLRRV